MSQLPAAWTTHLRIPASWSVSLAAALLVLVAGALAYRLVFSLLRRFAARTATPLDDALVRRMRIPARLLAGALSVHVFLAMRGAESPVLFKTAVVLELLLGTYLVIETLDTLVIHYWLGERQKLPVPGIVRHLVLFVLYVVAGLSILGSVTGVNVVPVLATSTVVTVVLGLALQETLGNLVAGLAIHAERPFRAGDWILVDGIEGKVVAMGWRTTRLRTLTSDIVSLPNAVVARARVQNFYAPDKVCGRNVEVLVAPDAPPDAVERAAHRAFESVPRLLRDPRPRVWLVGFAPLFQRYVLRIWIGDFRHHDDLESDVLKAMWRECRAEGIQVVAAAAAPGADPAAAETVAVAAPPRATPPAQG